MPKHTGNDEYNCASTDHGIGFGDVVILSPVSLDSPVLLEHLPCVNILACSLETVIVEKIPVQPDM
mgnify:CR=1 FL=1